MFYVRYLRNELVRRRARTIVTLLGLGLGVALVIVISSLSNGLDKAQKKTLNPLAGIGTDLTVTLAPQQDTGGGFGGPGGGGGGNRDLIQANLSVVTDLSKLGKPGTHFVHDFFLPGTQLTFQQTAAKQIASIAGVAQVTQGLTLLAEHQEGVVPKIVAKLKTAGGQTFQIQRNIPRPTAAQFAADAGLLREARREERRPRRAGQNGGGFGGGGGGGFGGGGRRVDRGAFSKCLPASLRQLRTQFTTPKQTLRQVLNPPQTNIKTTAYTIGGVDQTHPTMGVVTDRAGDEGPLPRRRRRPRGARLADVRGQALAEGRLEARPERHVVHGRRSRQPAARRPERRRLPAAEAAADAREPEGPRERRARARDRQLDVAQVQKAIEAALPQAQVASSKDVADQISGSLVDASNLSHDLGLVLSIIAAVAAFLLAALLALSSVGKRVRELGTLKALGWTQRMVVRQIAGESLAQGVLGGIFGIVLGVVVVLAIDAFGPTLTASSTTGGGNLLGLGAETARTATSSVSLSAPIGVTVLAIGFGLALLGGLVAGTAGALRAARLRPADALRQVD